MTDHLDGLLAHWLIPCFVKSLKLSHRTVTNKYPWINILQNTYLLVVDTAFTFSWFANRKSKICLERNQFICVVIGILSIYFITIGGIGLLECFLFGCCCTMMREWSIFLTGQTEKKTVTKKQTIINTVRIALSLVPDWWEVTWLTLSRLKAQNKQN